MNVKFSVVDMKIHVKLIGNVGELAECYISEHDIPLAEN